MTCKEKFKDHFPVLLQGKRIGPDFHTVFGRCRTGSLDASPFIFEYTEPAGPVYGKFGIVAEGRHIDSCTADNLKNVSLRIKFYMFAVNDHVSHNLFLPDGCKCAGFHAGTAFDTLFLIDQIR